MKISLASDHAGFRYKEKIKKYLEGLGHAVQDFGTSSKETCDYPDFVRPAAQAVVRGECARGIVLGGSGNGEAMTANRIAGIRCGLCWDTESARVARAHNDANVLSLGERMVSEKTALDIVRVFLNTPFEEGRHTVRVKKIDGLV